MLDAIYRMGRASGPSQTGRFGTRPLKTQSSAALHRRQRSLYSPRQLLVSPSLSSPFKTGRGGGSRVKDMMPVASASARLAIRLSLSSSSVATAVAAKASSGLAPRTGRGRSAEESPTLHVSRAQRRRSRPSRKGANGTAQPR